MTADEQRKKAARRGRERERERERERPASVSRWGQSRFSAHPDSSAARQPVKTARALRFADNWLRRPASATH